MSLLPIFHCLSWQEYGGGSEQSKATELALRGRILDQAQCFLLALVVHDPSRRAKCAEQVLRHDLSLGGERRRWLFDALTSSAPVSETTAAEEEVQGEELASASTDPPSDGAVACASSPATAGWVGLSPEALQAGGDMLFEEVRAAAPGGYFGLRGMAAGMTGNSKSGNGNGNGAGEGEGTLDWVFEKAEADRIAKGTNTDLVLLEVIMVMLKEQVSVSII